MKHLRKKKIKREQLNNQWFKKIQKMNKKNPNNK